MVNLGTLVPTTQEAHTYLNGGSSLENWNNKVTDKDAIYILGDFTLKKAEEYILNILNQLNGEKYLIKGNHDYWVKKKSLSSKFEWIKDYYELKYNKEKFVLCHYPLVEWNGSRNENSSYHLYGHTNNYSPISIDDIVKFFVK
ncbi:MAG: metallophosphoesterase [Lachnospirales bacterium]